MAWPDNPLDVFKTCTVCLGSILVDAYDRQRIERWGYFGDKGPAHLACGLRQYESEE